MEFKLISDGPILNIEVVYIPEEYSFTARMLDGTTLYSGGSSILINDLQLEIDQSGLIEHAWGLCPYTRWEPTMLLPPEGLKGQLVVDIGKEILPGCSYELANGWPVYVNREKGWVCIGDISSKGEKAIEFARDSIAVFESDTLKAIWLRPKELDV